MAPTAWPLGLRHTMEDHVAIRASRDVITRRRTEVARLRAQGLTTYEIAEQLPAAGVVNPNTGKPFTQATVVQDLTAMRKEWRAEYLDDTDGLVMGLLLEIREVRRQAWQQGELDVVLRGVKSERELLGLDRPTKVTITSSFEEDLAKLAQVYDLDVQELMLDAQEMLHQLEAKK